MYILLIFSLNNIAYSNESKLPYYIIFDLKDFNKNITLRNIKLSELKLIEGEKNINYRNAYYKNEYIIDFIELKGDYIFKYKNTIITAKNKKVYINNKEMKGSEVIIDKEQNINWNAWINYWEGYTKDN